MEQSLTRPVDRIKSVLSADSVQAQFRNVLAENSGAFIASIIDLYNNDTQLRECEPNAVVFEALKAASLKLPIQKSLGFAWIVAYSRKPTMQVGYKGYIQLALRTGWYRYINADMVYDGEYVSRDRLSGEPDLSGEKKSDRIIGYFAYIELTNGFRKTLYMTHAEVHAHAKKYSKSYGGGAWKSDPDKMCLKTVMRLLLSKYGILSVEMQTAIISEVEDEPAANSGEIIDIAAEPKRRGRPPKDVQDAEVIEPQPEPQPEY